MVRFSSKKGDYGIIRDFNYFFGPFWHFQNSLPASVFENVTCVA